MVTLAEVEKQLQAIGAGRRFRFWGHSEIIELQHVLIAGEQIHACLNGRYEGGFAILCATDHRLLLIDKKLFNLSVEDVRYDMIAEVDYSAQFISAAVKICTPTKNLNFIAFRPRELRALVTYMQQRVLEIRQQFAFGQQTQQQPAMQAAAQAWSPADFPMPTQPQQLPVQQQTQQLPPPQNVQTVEQPSLAMPTTMRNPYMHPPLMMRRRVGRFSGSIATATGVPKVSPGT